MSLRLRDPSATAETHWPACPFCGGVLLDLRNAGFNREQVSGCYRYQDDAFMCAEAELPPAARCVYGTGE